MVKADEFGVGVSNADEPIPPSERTTVNFERPDAMVGQQLDGRFLIEKNLQDAGADVGGIGVVYLARDTNLMGKEVVVKILNESALKRSDIIRKFLHEKEALIRLDHPGIVRILDSGTLTDGNPFLVMEYIKGRSLRKTMQLAGKMPFDIVASIIEAVTDALSAAHAAKILHRDVKPENIMLTPLDDGQYRVHLIDFGIARVGDSKLAPETHISRALGSVCYIAPEQLIGILDITPAADIFSTAIVAYEMLTGELPFKPNAIAEMYLLEKEGVQQSPRLLRPDLPESAESVLLSALEFEAGNRPNDAKAFGRSLARELRVDPLKTERYSEPIAELSNLPTLVAEPEAPSEYTRLQPGEDSTNGGVYFGSLKWVIAAFTVFVLVASTAGYIAWRNVLSSPVGELATTDTASVDPPLRHEFSYYLMLQKAHRNKSSDAPYIKTSGQEPVETGDRFKLFFQVDADGHLYVFNEGKDDRGKMDFRVIYPTPTNNAGLSMVRAGLPTETLGNTIGGPPGIETFWMIWSKEPMDDLEAVTKGAVKNKFGAVDNVHMPLLTKYLDKYPELKPENPVSDSGNQRIVFTSKGDLVVHRFELTHQ